ncbi:universal stress protein [Cryobacterium algoricola]|uniref:Universal stress protein n=2 Tax=Cryobacterium TaxID=69578 RepID=A0AA41QW67_9MICO|nr:MULTISPECIES: universal stress protein [Cryobacterium]MCI4657226.1 universal stress protein [Cryobacterium zhongshanensis]TFB90650.1 universal stress protein [Cryobacterium algoricola]
MSDTGAFHIVVGVDGSDPSLTALDWAIVEAKLRGADLTIVTTWSYPIMAGTPGDIVPEDSFKEVCERIQADALTTAADSGLTATGRIVRGGAVTVLLEAAQTADLLIVGSRGYGGFTGLLVGSVSNQLVHHAACPVLIVRSKRAPQRER